jgi:hypothetical protein
VALLIVGALAIGLGLRAKRGGTITPAPLPSAHALSEAPNHKPTLEELKELVAKVHPGMDVADALEQAERELDLNKLPLPERKERIARDIARYENEVRDRNWATSSEERLTMSFGMVAAESIFKLRDVQCKSSTCVATIGWATPDIGQAAYEAVVSTPIALGCRLQMLPPETGALQGLAFLDCADQRRQSEQAVPMVAEVSGPIPMRPEGSTASHSGP